MAAKSRLLVLRTLGSAIRSATRPGSPSLGDRAVAVPRMVRATWRGEYTGVSKARLALLAAAVGYVVSPVDLMPEGLLMIVGLADDAMVMSWIAATLVNETEAFLAWERSAPKAGTSYANPRYAGPQFAPSTSQGHAPSTGGMPDVTQSTASPRVVSSSGTADEARRHDQDDLPPRPR